MAKQFGVSDEAIAGLQDPGRHPFPPDQKAALLLADAMTDRRGEVPDPLFADVQRHFSEPQIVEIAAVIGLFNYFNRFNNALHMDITLTDPEVLVRRAGEAAKAAGTVEALCDRVVEILYQGRRYFWVGIYQRADDRLDRRAYRGPAPPCHSFHIGEGNVGRAGQTGVTRVIDDVSTDPTYKLCFAATRSELVVPIRAGGAVVGVIDVESDRPAAFDEEERTLVERVAALLVSRLT